MALRLPGGEDWVRAQWDNMLHPLILLSSESSSVSRSAGVISANPFSCLSYVFLYVGCMSACPDVSEVNFVRQLGWAVVPVHLVKRYSRLH